MQSTPGTYEMLIFRDQSLGMTGIIIICSISKTTKLRSIKIKSDTNFLLLLMVMVVVLK
jgi:hypothetical protein